MAELPFFPMAIDAYLADTRHLDDAEHGRYHLILYELWRSPNQRLPNDDEWLARRFSRSVDRVATELRPLMKEFCDCDGNWITQKRLSREFLRARKVTKQRSDAAKALWRKKKQASERIREDTQPRINSADEPTPTLTPTHTDSVAKATGADAPDPVKALFDSGVALLTENGCKEPNARKIIGKWRSERGDEATQAAIKAARAEGVTEPIAWITQRFAGKPRETYDQRRIREGLEVINAYEAEHDRH